MVNVVVLFSKIEEARSIKNLLVKNGINVTSICTTGSQAAQFIDNCDDGLLICGYKYSDMIFSDLEDFVSENFDMLVLTSKANYEECKDHEVVCLTMPLKTQDFINTVNATIDNILWKRKRRKDKPKVRTDEEKKIITAAKMKLMEENGFSEEEAHRYIQKKSMDSGTKIIEMAYIIINSIGVS